MQDNSLIDQLIDAFCCLPGVGKKSAQRMAYHILERNREGGTRLAKALQDSVEKVGHCRQCRTLSEKDICDICNHPGRDHSKICIVETPANVHAVEYTSSYRGTYFVLMGHLSPLDGIGPEDIGMDLLAQKLEHGQIKEVIIATNPTVEGEATAHYVSELAHRYHIKATRIAYGVPFGGELEYVDSGTLSHAINDRRVIS